jgi:uncharacterized protein YkwD
MDLLRFPRSFAVHFVRTRRGIWLAGLAIIILATGLRTASSAEAKVVRASGPPPVFALLRTSGGKFIISRTVVKSNASHENRKGKQPAFVANVTEELPIENVDIYTLSGQKYGPISKAELVSWLKPRKQPSRVLISADGKMVDQFYRQFAAEPTFILIRRIPAAKKPASSKKSTKENSQASEDGISEAAVRKGPLRSVPGGWRSRVTFVNSTGMPVHVFWVDYEGREKSFGVIAKGESYSQQTSLQHVWKFQVLGESIAILKTAEKPVQEFVIRSPKNGLTPVEAMVLKLVNEIRVSYQLPAFKHDSRLSAASRDHSRHMSKTGNFSHYSWLPGKSSYADRARAFGTSAMSENIAWDGDGARSVVAMWMNSPAHQANILDPSATTMGIGRSGVYWTQMFGSGGK